MTDLIKRDDALDAIDTALNNATGDLFDCHAAIRALPAVAVGVKLLVWEEVCERRSEEDPREEHTGGYEADCGFGSYFIDIGWGSDSYYWSVLSPDQFDIGSDFEDPEYAKAAAQADYEARILAALTPTPVDDSQPADPVVNDHTADVGKMVDPAAIREAALQARIEELVKERDDLGRKLATCEKYRDAYAECDRIGTQAVRDLEAKLAKAVEDAEKWRYAFAAQSRKLQAVLYIEGVKAVLAELEGKA
jgi:hypothetical protein